MTRNDIYQQVSNNAIVLEGGNVNSKFNPLNISFATNNVKSLQYELKSQLIPELTQLYEHSYAKLQSIFYRIDVSEKRLSELPQTRKSERMSALADLILERELIKVITKKLFLKKE